MSISDDIRNGIAVAGESVPLVLALTVAITRIINAKEDPAAQLDALQDAAEAIKLRLDQLKFPEDSKRAEREG